MAEARCLWCQSPFTPRRGGSPQRFCRASHRVRFHAATRLWAERAVLSGILTVDAVRGGRLEACTLPGSREAPSPSPLTDQPSPEPLKRFVVEIPQALINALIFREFAIVHYERDDLVAVLAALTRLGKKPTITETPEGEKVLSYG